MYGMTMGAKVGYADEWAEYVKANPDKYVMATEAHHQLGDISRDKPDYAFRDSEDDENYYGAWLTGFGFVGVKFPKSSARPLSADEVSWLADHPVSIA